jgi:hypothetical protein
VTSRQDGAGFFDLLRPAPQDGDHHLRRKIGRHHEQVERQEGLGAHRVQIGKGIGGGDLAEVEGVIDNRGEEIGRDDERPARIQPPDGGVIRRAEPDQQVGIRLLLKEIPQRPQNLRQRLRAQFGRSTGAGRHAGQPNLTTAGGAQFTHPFGLRRGL